MSEYKPITGELRKAMVRWGWCESDGTITVSSTPPNIEAEPFLTIVGSRFDHLCDSIDSIHAALEAENERLREQDHDGDWMKLPVDADGLPIHIGDVMVGEKVGGGYCGPFEVVGYVTSNGVIEPMDEHKLPRIQKYAHHQPDTWERIIEDACKRAVDGYPDKTGNIVTSDLVARCKALAGDAE